MAAIDDLVAQIGDEALRKRIQAELKRTKKQKKFGLVFEQHLPECTPLYDVPLHVGGLAARPEEISTLFVVKELHDGQAVCINRQSKEEETIDVSELVSVAEFGDPIYPYLQPIDKVENAPDSNLWHTLIEADNYHALQLLEYLYAGKVDCIYIDPPYNSGAKDWKYNNNYVDKTDQYRHSKWLSFMEKRLKLAKKLLNPRDSVLIVTIDEKEYLHLGCLLEELFPSCDIQMISSVINPKGSVRVGRFTRCDEYIFFIFIGAGRSDTCPSDYLFDKKKKEVRWPSLKRTGTNSRRASYQSNAFYPIFYDKTTGKYIGIGNNINTNVDRNSVKVPEGAVAVWPIDNKGEERIWQLYPDSFRELSKKGFINYGRLKNNTASLYYVSSGLREQIEKGEIIISGYSSDGVAQLQYANGSKQEAPKTIWNKTSHSASEHGTAVLMKIFNDKRFQYPKSIYAVKDTLYPIVKNKRNALIVDFFAGSGTTLHAVNLLNAEDGGHRRCIMVTNNEVSEAEAKALSKQGLKPGYADWEKHGIAHYVTWPRTICSIEGHDVNGQPLKGTYIGTDREMADGFPANAAFFRLGFLDKGSVARGEQLMKLLPVLWMKAGAVGACPEAQTIEPMLLFPQNRFAILTDVRATVSFIQQVNDGSYDVAYIVTDYEPEYREIASLLHVPETYQLYRDYLDNFTINTGRL